MWSVGRLIASVELVLNTRHFHWLISQHLTKQQPNFLNLWTINMTLDFKLANKSPLLHANTGLFPRRRVYITCETKGERLQINRCDVFRFNSLSNVIFS